MTAAYPPCAASPAPRKSNRFKWPANHPIQPASARHRSQTAPLIAEFEEIAASIKMDYWNILDYAEYGRAVIILQIIKQQFIISEIITRSYLIDKSAPGARLVRG